MTDAEPVELGAEPGPQHVVLLGLGPSVEQYLQMTKRLGSRAAFADEVWGINALGDIIQCDRVFHMDDVRIQEIRAEASPKSNIAAMLVWLRSHPGPVYTSRAHEGYPGLVEYPLEAVINETGFAYFNSTAAYAVAYAIYLGVEKITIFGFDFTYPNAHDAEKGRACVEFWLGIAAARGIKLSICKYSTLMDACSPFEQRLYGYDTVHVELVPHIDGKSTCVTFSPREKLPTAAEIEARYDHSRHPNEIIANGT